METRGSPAGGRRDPQSRPSRAAQSCAPSARPGLSPGGCARDPRRDRLAPPRAFGAARQEAAAPPTPRPLPGPAPPTDSPSAVAPPPRPGAPPSAPPRARSLRRPRGAFAAAGCWLLAPRPAPAAFRFPAPAPERSAPRPGAGGQRRGVRGAAGPSAGKALSAVAPAPRDPGGRPLGRGRERVRGQPAPGWPPPPPAPGSPTSTSSSRSSESKRGAGGGRAGRAGGAPGALPPPEARGPRARGRSCHPESPSGRRADRSL